MDNIECNKARIRLVRRDYDEVVFFPQHNSYGAREISYYGKSHNCLLDAVYDVEKMSFFTKEQLGVLYNDFVKLFSATPYEKSMMIFNQLEFRVERNHSDGTARVNGRPTAVWLDYDFEWHNLYWQTQHIRKLPEFTF